MERRFGMNRFLGSRVVALDGQRSVLRVRFNPDDDLADVPAEEDCASEDVQGILRSRDLIWADFQGGLGNKVAPAPRYSHDLIEAIRFNPAAAMRFLISVLESGSLGKWVRDNPETIERALGTSERASVFFLRHLGEFEAALGADLLLRCFRLAKSVVGAERMGLESRIAIESMKGPELRREMIREKDGQKGFFRKALSKVLGRIGFGF